MGIDGTTKEKLSTREGQKGHRRREGHKESWKVGFNPLLQSSFILCIQGLGEHL